jgi:hypothetical protein
MNEKVEARLKVAVDTLEAIRIERRPEMSTWEYWVKQSKSDLIETILQDIEMASCALAKIKELEGEK